MSKMPTPDTKIDEQPALFNIVCACMAVSNMGHEPDYDRLRWTMESWAKYSDGLRNQLNLSSAVCMIAEQYMEADEHQDIFEGEAESWQKNLSGMTWLEAGWDYPRVREIYIKMRRYANAS